MRRFTGIVQEGEHRGSALGFPTANIPLTDGNLSGVYAGRASIGDVMFGAAIFADTTRGILEAHLLDFSGTIYGQVMTVEVGEKLREHQRFEDDAALHAAIAGDIAKIRAVLSEDGKQESSSEPDQMVE